MDTNNIVREIIFGIVFAVVVVLIIGFIFYEFIPSKVVPEPENYSQAATTTKLLSQIKEEQQAEQQDKTDDVLKSYEITADDLAYSSDTEYVKGKNHPFYDYSSVSTSADSNSTVISDAPASSNITSTITESGSTNTTSSNTTKNTTKVDTNTLRDKSDQNKISK